MFSYQVLSVALCFLVAEAAVGMRKNDVPAKDQPKPAAQPAASQPAKPTPVAAPPAVEPPVAQPRAAPQTTPAQNLLSSLSNAAEQNVFNPLKRLFGGNNAPPATTPLPPAPEQTSECQAQRQMQMAKPPKLNPFIPVCDTKGEYMMMQCSGLSESCWCVNKKSGLKIEGTEKTEEQGAPDCKKTAEQTTPATEPSTTTTETPKDQTQPTTQPTTQSATQPTTTAAATEATTTPVTTPEPAQTKPTTTTATTATTTTATSATTVKTTSTVPTTTTASVATTTAPMGKCAKANEETVKNVKKTKVIWLKDCDEQGHFLPMQCFGEPKKCVCVDKISGEQVKDLSTENNCAGKSVEAAVKSANPAAEKEKAALPVTA